LKHLLEEEKTMKKLFMGVLILIMLLCTGCSAEKTETKAKDKSTQTKIDNSLDKIPLFPVTLDKFVSGYNSTSGAVPIKEDKLMKLDNKGYYKDLIYEETKDSLLMLRAIYGHDKKLRQISFLQKLPDEQILNDRGIAILNGTLHSLGIKANKLADFLNSEETTGFFNENGYYVQITKMSPGLFTLIIDKAAEN
jgi:hypothetical protein